MFTLMLTEQNLTHIVDELTLANSVHYDAAKAIIRELKTECIRDHKGCVNANLNVAADKFRYRLFADIPAMLQTGLNDPIDGEWLCHCCNGEGENKVIELISLALNMDANETLIKQLKASIH